MGASEKGLQRLTSAQPSACVLLGPAGECGVPCTCINWLTAICRGSLVTHKLDSSQKSTPAWSRKCITQKGQDCTGKSLRWPDDSQLNQCIASSAIRGLSWTTDGYALAVKLNVGWALYSPFGDATFRYGRAQGEANGSQEEETEKQPDHSPNLTTNDAFAGVVSYLFSQCRSNLTTYEC